MIKIGVLQSLSGIDYVYPRNTNTILEAYLTQKGIAKEDIFVNYTPLAILIGPRSWAMWWRLGLMPKRST